MTARQQEQADLYARSALYAETVLRNSDLADTFTRRGLDAAGDQWPAIYYRATGLTAPEPRPQVEKAKRVRKA